MSMRLTVKQIKNSRIPAIVGVCSDDPRLIQWANAFEEKAYVHGKFWGSVQLMQFCTTNTCLILPREVATIEAIKVGCAHVPVQNQWFSFVCPHGSCDCGTNCDCGCGCGDFNAIDKGTVCSFAKTTGVNQKIRLYPGGAADVGKKVIIQGKDLNGVWVRSSIDGAIGDGEQVTLASPFVDTVTVWGPGAPYAVIKEATSYRALMYAVDQTTAAETALADYAPSELNPSYRVISAPNLCCGAEGGTQNILAIVSLQHIPVETDNDFLLFQNLSAYQLGIQAEKAYEDGDYAKGDAYFYGSAGPPRNNRGPLRVTNRMGAIPLLTAELRRITGDKCAVNIQHAGVNLAHFL